MSIMRINTRLEIRYHSHLQERQETTFQMWRLWEDLLLITGDFYGNH